MAFNIKDEQAVDQLRELAELEGKSMSSVAAEAIADALSRHRRVGLADELMAIGREARAHMSEEFLAKTQQDLDDEIFDPETGLPW